MKVIVNISKTQTNTCGMLFMAVQTKLAMKAASRRACYD